MKSSHPALFLFVPWLLLADDCFGAVLTFEEFSPPDHDFINLFEATPYNGVTFTLAAVASDQLVASSQHASDYWGSSGTGPFLQPHSGRVALFNPVGLELDFATDQILTGLWVARPNLGPTGVGGTDHLTLTAYAADTPLASLTVNLPGTTPIFWDTSPLLYLSGITRYRIAPAEPRGDNGYFVADDFQFASASLAESCPCDGPWKNEAEYVRCVRAAASLLQEDGALTRDQAKEIIKNGRRLDCAGKDHH